VTYSGFHKKKTDYAAIEPVMDSSSHRVIATFRAGINTSWNTGADMKKYSPYFGPSAGFSLDFPLKGGSFFRTGFSFDRKGYSLKDSSTSFYRSVKDRKLMYYADTKVEIDYAVIPALICFPVGKSERFFLSTGPWLALKLNARNVGTAYNETRTGVSYTLRKTVLYDDLEKLIKDNDIGWLFGCIASFPVMHSKYKLDLALQYSAGFKDVYNHSYFADGEAGSDKAPVIRNGTLSFLIGIKIPPADH
jgi:hypothetical protein